MSLVLTGLLVVQVLSALTIIVLVLLQQGKGSDMGSAFGGGSAGSLFGAAGAANFLSRATKWAAVLFFAVTVGLAYVSHSGSRNPQTPTGVMEGYQDPSVPVMPGESGIPGDASVPQVPPATGVPVAPTPDVPSVPAPEAAPAAQPARAPAAETPAAPEPVEPPAAPQETAPPAVPATESAGQAPAADSSAAGNAQ